MGRRHYVDSPSYLEGPRLGPAGFAPVTLGGGCCCRPCRACGRYRQTDAHAAPVARSYTAALPLLGIFDLGDYAAVFVANLFPASSHAFATREGAASDCSSRFL